MKADTSSKSKPTTEKKEPAAKPKKTLATTKKTLTAAKKTATVKKKAATEKKKPVSETKKPVSETKKPATVRKKAATAAATLNKTNKMQVNVNGADHQFRVQEAAYYRAQARGFAPGNELEDWLAAEKEVLDGNPVKSDTAGNA